MLGAAHHHIVMTDSAIDVPPPLPEEDLEDGEIDDEEEVITEVVEETVSDSQSFQEDASGADCRPNIRMESCGINDTDDNKQSDEDKKKSHKKHQRKRKRHRESRERDLKKRRKRKMHSHDGVEISHGHGGSLSPHNDRRKKRKKHSRDHRDQESTPESDGSVEQYPSDYYASSVNGYGVESAAYSSSKTAEDYTVNNSSSAYYGTSTDVNSHQGDSNNYGSESGSDFEAQLAEYRNYKTHGDICVKDSGAAECREKRKGKMSPTSQDLTAPARPGEMYEEFMEYDESSKRTCKFFAEGKCLKGSDCSFSHDQSMRRQRGRSRKREMCKYYLSGHCHHGSACTYMHGDFPCKYFHTGVTCYAGDDCRFSHEPLTEETKEIIENLKDALSHVDDTWEIDELRKLGIEVQSKPPPGVGLLPTPDRPPLSATRGEQSHTSGTGSGIPSIFDISVVPTADFQKRIEENSVASLAMADNSEGFSKSSLNQMPTTMYKPHFPKVAPEMNGGALLPTPTALPDSNFSAMEQEEQCQEFDGAYDDFYEDEQAESCNSQVKSEDRSRSKSDDDVIKTDDEFIGMDNSTATDEQIEEAPVKVPDFLPATQKALFMRIHGKHNVSDVEKEATKNKSKAKNPDDWTYSSDEEEKPRVEDAGVIKMDTDLSASSSTETAQSRSATVESLLKMISRGDPSTVDTNLLSKVASVIGMSASSASSTESYNPASNVVSYNPAHTKTSPKLSSGTTPHHRDRKTSSLTSPGHSSRHSRPNPIRRRLSTQELTREPVVIPLVAKQNSNPTMHSAHPDPRLTLSRLLGLKVVPFSASRPRFCRDLILPGSSKMELKVTLSSEESKVSKRDPRLGRHKDPRLQRSNDPRTKSKGILTTPTIESKSSVPAKPSALLSKSSVSIPSLPELDLNLAQLNQQSNKENGDAPSATSDAAQRSYASPNLKLPRLLKAPAASPRDRKSSTPPARATSTAPPTIAPYDPRYMSSRSAKPSGSSDLPITTAPYDPRVLSSNSSSPSSVEVKKRTIQLPKLTPAPTYKPSPDTKPEGDQGDF